MEYQVYTIQYGDTLAGIAKKFTGNPWRFTELVVANPQVPRDYFDYMGKSVPTLKDIRVGQKIRIPMSWVPGSPLVTTGVGNVGQYSDADTMAGAAGGIGAGMAVLGIVMFAVSTAGTVGGIWYLVDKIRDKD